MAERNNLMSWALKGCSMSVTVHGRLEVSSSLSVNDVNNVR